MKKLITLLTLSLLGCALAKENITKQDIEKIDLHPEGLFASQLYDLLKLGNKKKNNTFKDYSETLDYKGKIIQLDFVAIKGGKVLLQDKKEVEVDDFYMLSTEVTYQAYKLWQEGLYLKIKNKETQDLLADFITTPTPTYKDMTFGMGKDDYPAICMTHLSARLFCMWLSAKTGKFYRLPTEAEWEYAAQASSKTKYGFNEDEINDYAIFEDNRGEIDQYAKVKSMKKNAFGLYGMYGNVAEWVLDYEDKDFIDNLPKGAKNPLCIKKGRWGRIAKGGAWYSPKKDLQKSTRFVSEEEWSKNDSNIPISSFYHTESSDVGFRIVSPRETPAKKDLHKYWPSKEEIKNISLGKKFIKKTKD